MKGKLGKNEWVGLFREIGLDEAEMNKWHRLFEEKHPEAHRDFLEWLGLGAAEVTAVRKACR